MANKYNSPLKGEPSTIGEQLTPFFYYKKALIENKDQLFFSPLADTITMPKQMGKTIKGYRYIPLIDDRNINDQGIDATGNPIANGNLFGSSKDVGTIQGRLPSLVEEGGRKNRVGFTRKTIEGSMFNFGFFFEFTEDSLQFDTDAKLFDHLSREAMNGAIRIQEAALQADLLTNAGTVRFAGTATSLDTMGEDSTISYAGLVNLGLTLDDLLVPTQTKIIKGTTLTDTVTVNACRVAYIGSRMVPILRRLKDFHGQPAFVSVDHYAAGTTVLNGEIGRIDNFRFIQVPRMQVWEGKGKSSTNYTYNITKGKLDVAPMLIVGDQSFTTIGFQTAGNEAKAKIINKKPSEETADRNDPYGKTGFSSIQWWYGFLALRPERIALYYSVTTQ